MAAGMRRYHLFEFNDQAWCPFRDTGLDMLRLLLNLGKHYNRIAPHLQRGLEATRTRTIIDLCSGGGGPWLTLARELEGRGLTPDVVLTDLFPNHRAFAAAAQACPRIRSCPDPVDATAMPSHLAGFRTLFTSFHHFQPEMAQSILADAVRHRAGIGIFEFTYRLSWPVMLLALIPSLLGIVLMAPLILLLMPFLRPVRWSALFWTYVIPITPLVLPLIAAWDGTISCMRTYTTAEMLAMANRVSGLDPDGSDAYRWTAGTVRIPFSPLTPVSYLVGVPVGTGGL